MEKTELVNIKLGIYGNLDYRDDRFQKLLRTVGGVVRDYQNFDQVIVTSHHTEDRKVNCYQINGKPSLSVVGEFNFFHDAHCSFVVLPFGTTSSYIQDLAEQTGEVVLDIFEEIKKELRTLNHKHQNMELVLVGDEKDVSLYEQRLTEFKVTKKVCTDNEEVGLEMITSIKGEMKPGQILVVIPSTAQYSIFEEESVDKTHILLPLVVLAKSASLTYRYLIHLMNPQLEEASVHKVEEITEEEEEWIKPILSHIL